MTVEAEVKTVPQTVEPSPCRTSPRGRHAVQGPEERVALLAAVVCPEADGLDDAAVLMKRDPRTKKGVKNGG